MDHSPIEESELELDDNAGDKAGPGKIGLIILLNRVCLVNIFNHENLKKLLKLLLELHHMKIGFAQDFMEG